MKNKFGIRLKECMQEKAVKQADLAKHLNVSEACINYWLNSKKQPTADNIIAAAQFFGVSTDYLLGVSEY